MTATKTYIIILLITILCPACRLNASMQANSEAEIMKSNADKQYEKGNFPGAFYLLKGYDISRRLNNNDLRNKYLTNIVAAYCNLGDVKKAKEFYEISKKATGSRDTVNQKYFLIYNSARIKQAEKKYDEAIAEHARAERYAIDNGLDGIYALYQECETGNILIKKHDYGKAISQGRKCLDMAAAADNDEMRISAYKIMHEAFAGYGMADSARKYKMMYLEAYDAAFRTKSMNQAKGRLQEYESRKSTEKINLLTSHINIYTMAVILVSTLLAVTVVLTMVLVRKNRNLRNAQKLLINKNNDIMKSYRQSSPAIPTMPNGYRDKDADDETDDENTGGVEMTQQQIDELLEKINSLTDRHDIISDPKLNLKTIADMAKSNTKYVSFAINTLRAHDNPGDLRGSRIHQRGKLQPHLQENKRHDAGHV